MHKYSSSAQDKSVEKAKKSQVSFFEDSSVTFRESKLKEGGRNKTENIFGMSNKQDDDEENIYLIGGKSSELDQTYDKNNQSYVSSQRCKDDGNDEKPLIDFEDLLKQQQEFTEASIPFTNHHIEDAIFIDEFHVIALEYIFFHNDEDPKISNILVTEEPSPKYITLKKKVAHADSKKIEVDDAESSKASSAPRPTVQEGVNMFEEPFEQLEDTRQNYLGSYSKHSKRRDVINANRDKDYKLQDLKEAAKKNQDKCNFISSNDDRVIVIPMLGKYHINEYGQLMKEDEIDIHFDCNFQPSKDLKMRLQLSHDRTRVVLPIQHQVSKYNRQKTSLSLLAWDVHSLRQYKLGSEIKNVLHNSLPQGKLMDANFIGVNEHIMISIIRELPNKSKYMEYFIFNSENGSEELRIDNKKEKVLQSNIKQLIESKFLQIAKKDEHSYTSKIRFLGILPKSKASKYTLRKQNNKRKTGLEGKDTIIEQRKIENSQIISSSIDNISAIDQENQDHQEFVERDLEEISKSDSFGTDTDDEEVLDISNDITRNHELSCTNDLELCFIFISTDIHGTVAEMENELDDEDKKSNNNMSQKSQRKQIYGEKIYWTKVTLTIVQIVQNGTDNQIEYIMQKAKDQFKKYTMDNYQFKEVPKNWFFDKDEKDKNWEGEIIVSVNRAFSQFGFMNRSQKQYIVYDFNDDDKNETGQEWLAVQNLPSALNDNSKVYHGRNQYTKDHIYLTIRIKGEGTTTYCFKKNGTKSKIQFSQDYENAIQDATHLSCHDKQVDDEVLFEESIFSSITISRDDQEMLLKTNRIVQSDQGTNTETIQRKTNSQYQQGMYPVFCYNIGLFKMIIQNTLGSGTQYVLQLNQHEAFMTFVQFNTFKDIGFNPGKMDIAGNSHFAFLTFDGKTETMNLNLMFVDIYHEVCDFKLFKSTRVFGIDDKKDKDIFVKAIVYSTQDRVTEREQDTDYQIKLLAQYPDHFCQRDQQEIQGPNVIKMFHARVQNKNESKDDNENDNDNSEKLSSSPVILEPERGYMYYVTEQAGQCKIYEIIPTSDLKQNHLLVFEIKSENCFGFSLYDGLFLFIDNEKIITVLERAKESRKLLEKQELNLKEKDSPNFLMDKYSHCILSQKYLIQKTKIFYLFGNKPLQTGLLDMEELAEPRFDDDDEEKDYPIPIKYVKGPYGFQEANEFGIIIRDDKINIGDGICEEQSYFFSMNIAKLPEGRFQQIITDFGKQVDLTTFLNDDEEEKQLRNDQFEKYQKKCESKLEEPDEFEVWYQSQGKILTKIAQKWMLFDADCEFINRVNFYNENKMPKEKIKLQKTSGIKASEDQIEDSQGTQDEEPNKEEEAVFIEENKLTPTELEDLNLHAMSENNKYYFFIKEEEIKRNSQGRLSDNRSNNSTNLPRPRGSQSPSRKFKLSTSKGDDQLTILDKDNGNQNTCNTAGHKDIIPTSIQVFSLQNTGNGDLMDMELSEQREYKKMFKRSFFLNIKDHPEIFDKESKNPEATEKRQMYIEDDGAIHIIKTWYIPNDPKYRDSEGKHKHDQEISTKIYSIKKSTESGKAYRVESSQYTMNFTNCVLEIHKRAFNKLKKLFSTQIKTEKKVQQDLPKNLKNNSKIERLEWNIKVSDIKIDDVIKTFMLKNKQSSQIDENIFVIKCGRDVQVAKIRIGDPNFKYEMKTIDCNFESDVEIVQILSTSVDNEIQIIARDEDRMCIIILSWNFELDQETSMVQFPINGDTRPGQHCVMGMETKRNYFAQDFYIYDLEFNIPLQNTENPIQYEAAGQKFRNQRKIFKNSSRSLSLNSESILKLAYNRMDLLFWKNIVELGEKTEIISENTDLEQFNQVFNGYSMFHYFVANPDVIEYVCKMYKFKKEQNTLNERQKYVPLLILHLDNDGLSALDYAVNSHRPKSFKCMIDLVTEVSSDFCLTKLMLNLLQVLIKQGTFMNHSFFDTTSFKPIMMQPALIVQWPESMDDYAFASNTSLITKKQIQMELYEDPYGLDEIYTDDKLKKKQIEIDRDVDYDKVTGMRKVVLKTDQNQDQTFVRVQVEALDFDWLFEGNNTQAFLELLGSQDESAIYSKKSMKILIKLLWNKYQPKIKQSVLYPYLVYVISFILLQPYIDITMSEQFGFWYSSAFFLAKLAMISILYLYFVKFEFDQFLQDKEGYFFDAVNQMDITQYAMNAAIIYMFIQDWYLDQKIMSQSWKKALYAIACFVMWIKIYYMMRIFSQTAHFITLMTQIVSDVKTFTIMLCIILLAFANFFYVIDMGDKDSNYVGLYTGNNFINVLMEMYFISLGNFNIGSYSNGDNSGIIWLFFILASFIIVVVFMNLLISIMGNTLGDVQAVQEQSQIQEQAEMIIEYFSLIKMDECFKNKKYVIYISRDQNQIIQEDNTQTIIMELKKALFDQLEANQSELNKRNQSMEKNIRQISKQQNSVKNQISSVKNQIGSFKNQIGSLSQDLKLTKELIEKVANQQIL